MAQPPACAAVVVASVCVMVGCGEARGGEPAQESGTVQRLEDRHLTSDEAHAESGSSRAVAEGCLAFQRHDAAGPGLARFVRNRIS